VASALAIEGVTKVYGRTTVVDDVSFTVEPQEILGLVGPNGAGKTTTIRMALDIIHPDTGAVALFGSAPTRQALQRVGYLPEERGLYQKAVLRDVLRYLGRLKGLSNKDAQARTDAMLQRVGLYEHRAKKVQALSRGMSQLAQFASALLHLPDLIILDEPFSGLDPLNVQVMKEIISEQQQRGASIIFSSHDMEDVEEMCERVVLISSGTVLLYGVLDELKRARGIQSIRVTAPRQPADVPGVSNAKVADGQFEYMLTDGVDPNTVLRSFLDNGIPVERFEVALPSLREMFIEEVNRARSA
jgi:ABC-2 type transport system ATP-binding protein